MAAFGDSAPRRRREVTLRSRRTGLALPLALVCALAAMPFARADGYEETEHRLKVAGIDEAFRARVHEAIGRGVRWLRAKQDENGMVQADPGRTALAGMALRHCGLSEGRDGAHLALKAVRAFPADLIREQTYVAGAVTMLLLADRSGCELAGEIHARLRLGPLKADGYWAYGSAGGVPPPNLSTSQFGALGLWGAEMLGVPRARDTWRAHLEALLEHQCDDGSWGYEPRDVARDNPSYPSGTFMGLAAILLAQHALADDLAEDTAFATEVTLARRRAEAALRRHVQWTLSGAGYNGNWVLFPYYRHYAMEKVAVFLGLEDIGGADWYREGAEWLLKRQYKDGGWGPVRMPPPLPQLPVASASDPVRTAFALLFLLRASESYRPTTPRSVDLIRTAVTPSAGGETVAPPAPPPRPTVLQLATAQASLDRLEAWIDGRRRESPQPALKECAFIRRAWEIYSAEGAPTSDAHEAWKVEAQGLLLRLATAVVWRHRAERPLMRVAAFAALDVLAQTDARFVPRLQEAVAELKLSSTCKADIAYAWTGASLDAMRRIQAPGLASWIVEACVDSGPKAWWRTSAALTTLGGIRGLTGGERHGIAAGVMERMERRFRTARSSQREAADLARDLAVLLRRLAPEPTDGAFPDLGGRDPARAMAEIGDWWQRNHAVTAPPWQ